MMSRKDSVIKFSQNTTSNARSRVIGSGPDRKLLPPFLDLGGLSRQDLEVLNSVCDELAHINDLKVVSNYEISQHCPLRFLVPKEFKHILLTVSEPNEDPKFETSYTSWRDFKEASIVKSIIGKISKRAFRVRFSILEPGDEFSWHIDTNTSVACRFIIILNDHDSFFEIDTRGEIHSVPLEVGHIYFVNTGWKHRVFNNGKSPRKALLFGSRFEDINLEINPSEKSLY